MTRDELIELGRKIVVVEIKTEEEHHALCRLFDKNVPHPNGSNLFYWPENYNARKMDISQYNPTVEQVVDKCLSYRPICL